MTKGSPDDVRRNKLKAEQDAWQEELRKNPKTKKTHEKYVKDHLRRLREAERIARGEFVPNDDYSDE